MRKKCQRPASLFIVIAAMAALALFGCDGGISKEDRIATFKANIQAGTNTRDNFRGHPNAASIGPTTFTVTEINEVRSGGAFTGGDAIGDTFTIFYNLSSGAPSSASGTFYSEKSGTSEDWYIYQITVDGVTYPN